MLMVWMMVVADHRAGWLEWGTKMMQICPVCGCRSVRQSMMDEMVVATMAVVVATMALVVAMAALVSTM